MPLSTVLPILILAAIVGGSAWFTARLLRYRTAAAEEQPPYDAARYAPMQRLLDPADLAFLASQPGITAQDVARAQRDRRRIFRTYLYELGADFERLHAEARELVAASTEANHELVENLIRLQARFWMAVVGMEFQLALDSVGIGQVDPSRILEAVDSLNAAIARATAVHGPVAV